MQIRFDTATIRREALILPLPATKAAAADNARVAVAHNVRLGAIPSGRWETVMWLLLALSGAGTLVLSFWL